MKMAKKYLGLNGSEGLNWGMMRGGMSSVADLFIAQMQDYLGLGNESRMNTPGIASGNKISRTYTDNAIREALALITETGVKTWYANSKTIYNGLAGIKDNNGRPLFIENTTSDDPLVRGRIYGGIVKLIGKYPVLTFFKKVMPAALNAFGTCSSSASGWISSIL